MKIKTIILLVLISTKVYCQTSTDSLSYSSNNFSNRLFGNRFDKQLNTYNFSTQLRQFYQYDKIFLGINENFNSTIIDASDKNIKDEHYLQLFGQYDFSDDIKTGFFLSNNYYSDDRSLAINKVSLVSASLFLKYFLLKNILITPFGGISNNNQIGEKDNGFVYGAEGNIDKYDLGDFEISSLMKFQNEDISPRKNTFRFINFDVNSIFEENFSNTIGAYFVSQRKDFYFTADQATIDQFGIANNLQSRLETNYFIHDKMKFTPANSPFSFDINGKLGWRDIERNTRYVSIESPSSTAFDTKIREFKMEASSNAEYKVDDLQLSLRLSYSEREEKHQPRKIEGLSSIVFNEREKTEAQKNNSSKLAVVSLTGIYNFSRADRILLSLFQRKLVYDTPSELNYDDRDELLSIGRILYERKFNPYLKAFINFEGSFNKIVYIFAERSSNNNIKRFIKLSSGGTFTSGKFTSSNSAEVSANYTVFDYEKLNPNFRSYSFRQFVYRDSTTFAFTKYLKLFFTGYIKLSEQGDFKWSSFTNKPQRYLNEQYAEPKLFYNLFGFNFGAGIRYFSLSTFNIIDGTQKNKVSEYVSIGPLSEINYDITEKILFKTYGWYEFIKTENNTKRELANFNLVLTYKF